MLQLIWFLEHFFLKVQSQSEISLFDFIQDMFHWFSMPAQFSVYDYSQCASDFNTKLFSVFSSLEVVNDKKTIILLDGKCNCTGFTFVQGCLKYFLLGFVDGTFNLEPVG